MSYQVIARKYRPQRFSDVVGQEHVTQTLANAIQQGRIAHAYMFCGPRGTGKTTVARIFAKCLNCTGGPKVDFDDNDPRCKEITEGRSLDVLEIDGASNNGVEQVRELRDTVQFVPASSKFKIFIIDEVHMLSTAAFNALLKTLEEPPPHVKFMFATTDPEKVLPTILSRCQRFDLRRIPTALIVSHLAHIASLEQITIDQATLFAVARGADGGMRDAESALDQLISFCGTHIQENDALSMFGLTSQSQVMNIAVAILNGDSASVIQQVDSLVRHGKDLSRLMGDILSHFRNLLVYQVSKGDLSLLEISEAEAEMLKQHASSCPTEILTRIMEVLTDAEGWVKEAASPRIYVEVSLLKAVQARRSVSLDHVLQQLKQLRSGGGSPSGSNPPAASPSLAAPSAPTPAARPAAPSAAPPTPRSAPAATAPTHSPTSPPVTTAIPTPAQPAPAPAATTPPPEPVAPGSATRDLHVLWPQLLEAVGRVSQFTRSYLLEAFPVSFQGSTFVVGFDPALGDHIDLVNNTKNVEMLQTKLKELGHPGCLVKFTRATMPPEWSSALAATQAAATTAPSAPPPSTPPSPSPAPITTPAPTPPKTPVAPNPASKAAATPSASASAPAPAANTPPPIRLNPNDFKSDPLIQQALEIFKGRIVEVRA